MAWPRWTSSSITRTRTVGIVTLRASKGIPGPERGSQQPGRLSGVSAPFVMVPPMMTKPVTTTIAALALAGLLGVGCGDGGDDDVASASDDDSGEQAQGDDAAAEEELLDWVECMRDAGVDIPEPT